MGLKVVGACLAIGGWDVNVEIWITFSRALKITQKSNYLQDLEEGKDGRGDKERSSRVPEGVQRFHLQTTEVFGFKRVSEDTGWCRVQIYSLTVKYFLTKCFTLWCERYQVCYELLYIDISVCQWENYRYLEEKKSTCICCTKLSQIWVVG